MSFFIVSLLFLVIRYRYLFIVYPCLFKLLSSLVVGKQEAVSGPHFCLLEYRLHLSIKYQELKTKVMIVLLPNINIIIVENYWQRFNMCIKFL